MIQLRGKLTVQRIGGSINLVPTAGSPPLQGKVVFPSHEEQLIKPDEDYYGLSVVTVVAVPRIPCAETSVKYEKDIVYGHLIDIVGETFVKQELTGDLYYYNREQLPEIPSEIIAMYPYICIVRTLDTIYLYASTERLTYDKRSETNHLLIIPTGAQYVRYQLNTDLNVWAVNNYGVGVLYISVYVTSTSNVIWWSNADITVEGSETSEVFFPASNLTVERANDPTHYYYNGIHLPKIPSDALASYPYWCIRTTSDGTTLIGSVNGFYFSGTTVRDKSSAMLKGYTLVNDAWEENADSLKYSAWTVMQNNVLQLAWANDNILSGSATATTIYYYGTLAVPDPV